MYQARFTPSPQLPTTHCHACPYHIGQARPERLIQGYLSPSMSSSNQSETASCSEEMYPISHASSPGCHVCSTAKRSQCQAFESQASISHTPSPQSHPPSRISQSPYCTLHPQVSTGKAVMVQSHIGQQRDTSSSQVQDAHGVYDQSTGKASYPVHGPFAIREQQYQTEHGTSSRTTLEVEAQTSNSADTRSYLFQQRNPMCESPYQTGRHEGKSSYPVCKDLHQKTNEKVYGSTGQTSFNNQSEMSTISVQRKQSHMPCLDHGDLLDKHHTVHQNTDKTSIVDSHMSKISDRDIASSHLHGCHTPPQMTTISEDREQREHSLNDRHSLDKHHAVHQNTEKTSVVQSQLSKFGDGDTASSPDNGRHTLPGNTGQCITEISSQAPSETSGQGIVKTATSGQPLSQTNAQSFTQSPSESPHDTVHGSTDKDSVPEASNIHQCDKHSSLVQAPSQPQDNTAHGRTTRASLRITTQNDTNIREVCDTTSSRIHEQSESTVTPLAKGQDVRKKSKEPRTPSPTRSYENKTTFAGGELSENYNDYIEEDNSFNGDSAESIEMALGNSGLHGLNKISDHPIRHLFDIGQKNVKHKLTTYKVRNFLKSINMREIEIKGDGHCFTTSVIECLKDYNIYKSHEQIAVLAMEEIHSHLPHYYEFIPDGDRPTFVDTAANFFQRGHYEAEVIDCCIIATANALGVNLNIFSRQGSYTRLSVQDAERKKTNINLFFQFYSKNKTNKDAHYNAIVSAEPNTQPHKTNESTVTDKRM